MYHVFGTGLTIITLYLLSYLFFRIGYYSLQFHKKLWNTILAIFFISTACVGIFMALQANYKWPISILKSIVKWHVELGIGMAATGIFHFFWHISYFGKLFTPQENRFEKSTDLKISSSIIRSNLFMLGFVSASVQFLLLREMLNITGGYELITGTFLASWLITSAIGVSFASKSSLNDIKKINVIFSLSPLISLLLLFALSRLFVNPGETPSLLTSIIFTFLVLAPFCITSGFTFIKLVSFAKSSSGFVPGKSFSIETAGGIASGIVISLLTSGVVNTYRLLLMVIFLTLSYLLYTFFNNSLRVKILSGIILMCSILIVVIFDPDIFFRQILMQGISVSSSVDTPYGNITKGSYKNEESVFYNERLINYKNDVIEREEDIHYAMLQRDTVENIILISGSLKSHLPELMKFHPKKIIYIERDPELARLEQTESGNFSGELIVANEDAFQYIRSSADSVDAVLLLLPPPSTLLLNRYYTTEFFYEIRKRLKVGGIFLCSPGYAYNYYNKESLNLYSSVFNSLTEVFKNVYPVSGNKLYFISSDQEISLSFCKLVNMRNIKNVYVSSDYLSDELITKKSEDVRLLMDPKQSQNRSAFPLASFYWQSLYISRNISEKIPLIVIMIALFAVPFISIKRRNMVMYFSALALAGLEIILLFTLQLIIGNMYQLTGLLIAGLMAGLAVGSAIEFHNPVYMKWKIKYFLLFLFYVILGFGYDPLLSMKSGLPAIFTIIGLSFLPAFFTGSIFRELSLTTKDSGTSEIYRADLFGSAIGFLAISGIMIPAFGLKVSVYLLSFLILTGFLFGTINNKE
jgi:spermidine synthase